MDSVNRMFVCGVVQVIYALGLVPQLVEEPALDQICYLPERSLL